MQTRSGPVRGGGKRPRIRRRDRGETDKDDSPANCHPVERASPGLSSEARKARAKKGPCPDPPESSSWGRAAAIFAAAESGERFFGYFLVATSTRKYLAFGCESPIKKIAVRRQWLWELWSHHNFVRNKIGRTSVRPQGRSQGRLRSKFLVCRDETRLTYIAGQAAPQPAFGTSSSPE